jgi:lipopolysaccharide/colanic/teichoic acid biosynthesis glycosyltransferase
MAASGGLEVSLLVDRSLGFGKEADMFVLAACWFTFGTLFQTVRTPPNVFLAWVLGTTVLLMISLDAIGYFERFTPHPELSGVLSLLLAVPFSAFCARWAVAWATGAPLLPYSEALRASIWVAMAFELSQWVIFKLHRASGRRWVLLTCLLPEELDMLRTQVEESGQSWWIHIQPVDASDPDTLSLHRHESLVISRGAVHDLKNHSQFLTAHLRGQRIIDVRQLLKEFRGRLDLRNADAWTFFLGSRYQDFLTRVYFHLKAFLEPILAFVLIVLASPLLACVALSIALTTGRPILYCQERLGYRGRRFSLFKFRTMSTTAEKAGPQWAGKDDPRVTPLGRWLRKTRLDELPQLLNVMRGELSFVGPRPERPEFYEVLQDQVPLFSLRLLVRPGITGWAQVMQGYVASIEECKTKLEYDLYYVQNMSPRLDLRTWVNTLAMMIRGNSGQ